MDTHTVTTSCKACHWTNEGCAVLEINPKVLWFIYAVALNSRRNLFGGCPDTITGSTDWCGFYLWAKGCVCSETECLAGEHLIRLNLMTNYCTH